METNEAFSMIPTDEVQAHMDDAARKIKAFLEECNSLPHDVTDEIGDYANSAVHLLTRETAWELTDLEEALSALRNGDRDGNPAPESDYETWTEDANKAWHGTVTGIEAAHSEVEEVQPYLSAVPETDELILPAYQAATAAVQTLCEDVSLVPDYEDDYDRYCGWWGDNS